MRMRTCGKNTDPAMHWRIRGHTGEEGWNMRKMEQWQEQEQEIRHP